jgi:hypothetical protein
MTKLFGKLAAAAGLVCLSYAAAQPPAAQVPAPQAQPQRPVTIEERVTVLERGLASVTTRFERRDAAAVAPSSSFSLEGRITALERSLDRIAQDLQRIEREADSAQRAADAASRGADDARRTAMEADRVARDAQMRVR